MKARKPKAIWTRTHQNGRPFLSTYWRNLGPIPRTARACIVRVEAKVQELATERTEIVMTALKTEGRPLTPVSWIAKTKGEALVLELEAPSNFSLLEGKIKPTRKRETT